MLPGLQSRPELLLLRLVGLGELLAQGGLEAPPEALPDELREVLEALIEAVRENDPAG